VAKYNFGFQVIKFCDQVFQEIRISGDIFQFAPLRTSSNLGLFPWEISISIYIIRVIDYFGFQAAYDRGRQAIVHPRIR